MGKKDFMLAYGPYKNIFRGEDRDLWARLAFDKRLIWLIHQKISSRIEKTFIDTIYRKFYYTWDKMVNNFKVGIYFKSYFRFIVSQYPFFSKIFLYEIILIIPAYIYGRTYKEKYLPGEMRDYKKFDLWVVKNKKTLPELIQNIDCKFNTGFLSDKSKKIFYLK